MRGLATRTVRRSMRCSGTLPSLLDRLADQPDFLLWIEIDRLIPPWDIPREVFEAYLQHEMIGQEDFTDRRRSRRTRRKLPPTRKILGRSAFGRRGRRWNHCAIRRRAHSIQVIPMLLPGSLPRSGQSSRYSTRSLGRSSSQLRERLLDQSATWIMTSDFGYPLGEHGQIGVHRPWLHEELVHIPLIIRYGGWLRGRTPRAGTSPNRPMSPRQFSNCFTLLRKAGRVYSALPGERCRCSAVMRFPHWISASQPNGRFAPSDWAYLLPDSHAGGRDSRAQVVPETG